MLTKTAPIAAFPPNYVHVAVFGFGKQKEELHCQLSLGARRDLSPASGALRRAPPRLPAVQEARTGVMQALSASMQRLFRFLRLRLFQKDGRAVPSGSKRGQSRLSARKVIRAILNSTLRPIPRRFDLSRDRRSDSFDQIGSRIQGNSLRFSDSPRSRFLQTSINPNDRLVIGRTYRPVGP